MNLKTLNDYVIIDRLESNKQTASGIILKSSNEAERALSVGVGPEVSTLVADLVVVVNWMKATKIQGERYYVKAEDVIAILTDE